MSTFPQITTPPQASAEVLVNRMGETLEHQAIYGLKHSTTTGLSWGYYGGRWGGFSVADGVLTLTDASTNYIVVAIASGVASVASTSTNWDNTTDYVRVYKITTAGGVVTAVEDHRAGPGGVHGGAGGGGGGGVASVVLAIACSDETTALTTGVAKAKFINPFASVFSVTAVVASLSTAQTSGSTLTIDINEAGVSILSTKLTIDNTETNSSTAATPPVISDDSIAAYAEISVDIDTIGDGTAKGLKIYLIGHL